MMETHTESNLIHYYSGRKSEDRFGTHIYTPTFFTLPSRGVTDLSRNVDTLRTLKFNPNCDYISGQRYHVVRDQSP